MKQVISQGIRFGSIPAYQEYLHKRLEEQKARDNTDDLDNVRKPDVSSLMDDLSAKTTPQTLPVIKLISKKRVKPSPSRKKLKKSKSALGRSHSRHRDCKACHHVLQLASASPVRFTADFEKLKYYTKAYQQYVLAEKFQLAEQFINKIKCNHPIFSRLQLSLIHI